MYGCIESIPKEIGRQQKKEILQELFPLDIISYCILIYCDEYIPQFSSPEIKFIDEHGANKFAWSLHLESGFYSVNLSFSFEFEDTNEKLIFVFAGLGSSPFTSLYQGVGIQNVTTASLFYISDLDPLIIKIATTETEEQMMIHTVQITFNRC